MSRLNWSEDAIGIGALHPDYPAQADTRVGHVNQAVFWEWLLGEGRQACEFSDYVRQDVRRRRRQIVPGVPDFVSDGRPCATRRSNGQLRRVVLLGLKQNQESEPPDGFFIHVLRGYGAAEQSRKLEPFHLRRVH